MLELCDLMLDPVERNDQLLDVIDGRRSSQFAEIGVSIPFWDIVISCSLQILVVLRRRYPGSACFLDRDGEDILD